METLSTLAIKYRIVSGSKAALSIEDRAIASPLRTVSNLIATAARRVVSRSSRIDVGSRDYQNSTLCPNRQESTMPTSNTSTGLP
ncbi:hypothetical protein [Roseiconus lacunae]|uniref:Uncharacterized protein n=1 Tax=Roseiconus lacunae TaxID=2605694 RepID=A0ABT7PME6_9BACT|nr:hypothetical protein [Roseiconus lacunae]MDM4017677.1 hypothetical protein [Roseiconus lacunae]